MKVNREDLLQKLDAVQVGLSPKETIQQSTCFVFKNQRVWTYNAEVTASCPLDFLKKDYEGAVVAKPVCDILRKLTEAELDLSFEKKQIIIKGKKKHVEFPTEAEIFLPLDKLEVPENWHKVHKDFVEAVSITIESAGKKIQQVAHNCLHVTPDYIEANDNFQACRYKLKTGVQDEFLVRRDSIKCVMSIEAVEMAETESWLHFKTKGEQQLSVRRFVESYRDLAPILKVEGGEPATLPKGLAEDAERAFILVGDDKVTIDLIPGSLRIQGAGPHGKYTAIKEIKYKGKKMKFRITPKLLGDLCTRYNDCEITKDRLKVDGGKFLYVVALSKSDRKEK